MAHKKYLVLKPEQTSKPYTNELGWGWTLKAIFICEEFTALFHKAGNKYKATIDGKVIYEDENHHYLSAKCIWTNSMRVRQDPSLLDWMKKKCVWCEKETKDMYCSEECKLTHEEWQKIDKEMA